MATVTGLTKERMQEIIDATIVDADVVGDNLILTTDGGATIDAGNVRGPSGAWSPILAGVPILDVGQVGQIRAGRQLTPADFTDLGLSAPIGLYNLSNAADSSGNGRNLVNKGAVGFDVGINGVNPSAVKLKGDAAQALYIADTGAADPFRIRTGSIGCWVRTAKKATYQTMMGKYGGAGQRGWLMDIANTNVCYIDVSNDGTAEVIINSLTDVTDDRWHFVVGVFDGTTVKLYVDSTLEASAAVGLAFPSNSPFNIGSRGADAATAASSPNYGRIDEAFVTSDILSEDEIRSLYCVRIAHTLGTIPFRGAVNVHRLRKGAALIGTGAGTDFPTQPIRLHNFVGGSLADGGSGAVALTNNGGALPIQGPDGTKDGAFNFVSGSAQSLSATDAGLPSGTNPRSYGVWLKTTATSVNIMGWGAAGSAGNAPSGMRVGSTGDLAAESTPSGGAPDMITSLRINDGLWHFAVVTEENAPADGVKRKLYVDGRLSSSSTALNSVTLAGANRFRVGSAGDGTSPFTGQLSRAFMCNYVLTQEQILKLYQKSSQDIGRSPKNPGDHIETMTATDLLCTFDMLEPQFTIDLGVAG